MPRRAFASCRVDADARAREARALQPATGSFTVFCGLRACNYARVKHKRRIYSTPYLEVGQTGRARNPRIMIVAAAWNLSPLARIGAVSNVAHPVSIRETGSPGLRWSDRPVRSSTPQPKTRMRSVRGGACRLGMFQGTLAGEYGGRSPNIRPPDATPTTVTIRAHWDDRGLRAVCCGGARSITTYAPRGWRDSSSCQ